MLKSQKFRAERVEQLEISLSFMLDPGSTPISSDDVISDNPYRNKSVG